MTAGLTSTEAQRRLTEVGENRISSQRRTGAVALFIAQFKSPIILILIGAAIVSLFLQGHTDATLILAIVLASGFSSHVHAARQRRREQGIFLPFAPYHVCYAIVTWWNACPR